MSDCKDPKHTGHTHQHGASCGHITVRHGSHVAIWMTGISITCTAIMSTSMRSR